MTVAAIRDTMTTAISALLPHSLQGNPFKLHRQHGDFRAWAEQNPGGAFRQFSVRGSGTIAPPEVTNTDVELVSTEIECVVAYPMDFRGGPKMVHDRDDLIESDLRQIDNTIGTNGYATIETAVSGTVTTIEATREEGQACVFAVLRLKVGFYRAMP